MAQTGCIKQNQINCLKIDIAIDFCEKGAKRIATLAVETACLLTDVDIAELVGMRQVALEKIFS